jgi:hypothetical protein
MSTPKAKQKTIIVTNLNTQQNPLKGDTRA